MPPDQTPGESILRCAGIQVTKRKQVILNGIDLNVDAGEMVAIRGDSGAGKSTLLRVLCGLETPSAGASTFNGETFTSWPERRRAQMRLTSFGVVFQSSDLIPELTVGENVELPLLMLGRTRTDARRSARAQLDDVGVGNLYDRRLTQISGGQQQRVAIARALVHHPVVLLADEPTGSLDDSNASDAIDLMLALVRERGAAALVVTHAANIASRCDRVLHLRSGRFAGNFEAKAAQ